MSTRPGQKQEHPPARQTLLRVDELLREFVLESREALHAMQEATDISVVYRKLQTLEETCGFLGVGALQEIAAAGSGLAAAVRGGAVQADPSRHAAFEVLFAAIARCLDQIERGESVSDTFEALLDTLHRLQAPSPVPVAEPDDGDDILDDFVLEAEEHLASAERALARLQADAGDTGALSALYRAFHSIRAACQFFPFEQVSGLTSAAETALLPHRSGEGPIAGPLLAAVAPLVPVLRGIFSRIRGSGLEGEGTWEPLAAALQAAAPPRPAPISARAPERLLPRETPLSVESPDPTFDAPLEEAKPASLIADFLAESREALDLVEQDLVALEQAPGDATLLSRIFRCFHTLKGSCGFLGFPALEEVTHAGETLLGRLRDGALHLDGPMTATLLALVDRVRYVLERIQEQGDEQGLSHEDLVARLTKLARGEKAIQHHAPVAAAPAPTAAAPTEAQDNGIRVDVAVLDQLMTLVGELVLVRNQVKQRLGGTELWRDLNRELNRVTAGLQEGVMKTRMRDIGTLWSKLPRVVRDVSKACGKQVRLELSGHDTELDRSLLEAIRDPLTHIVRNAIDHGIEAPRERVARQKPKTGTIRLNAYHKGGQVNIEISDDGAGLDLDRIKVKAVEKGLVDAAAADLLSERELVDLIMRPGFSTSDHVTHVSGRGVGMDVVKTNIEHIGGVVEIATRPHEGTTIRLKIPLTLAILPTLLVTAGGTRFAVPQANLEEVVHVESPERVQWFHSIPVYPLRDELIPLAGLAHLLETDTAVLPSRQDFYILVLQADVKRFGLVVDTVLDTEDIVVKPLGRFLAGLAVYAGCAILGDGSPILILDVPGLAGRASLAVESHAREVVPEPGPAPDSEEFLVVHNGHDERFVMPLSQVVRLETFPRTRVERSGAQQVLQYRDGILPLVTLDEVVARPGGRPLAADVQCVVCQIDGNRLGLVVDGVVDIVADTPQHQAQSTRHGVQCRAIVADRVVEMLDMAEVFRRAYPIW